MSSIVLFFQKKGRSIMELLRTMVFRRSFKGFGAGSYLGKIAQLSGLKYISIGTRTGFADGLTMTAWDQYSRQVFTPNIIIGNDCHFGAWNHLTAIDRIEIGDGCLTGKWVTITDNDHGNNSIDQIDLPPVRRPLHSKGPVIIGKNVWIGDKVTILSGVKVGDGCVIAANAVVTKDIPSGCVAAGIPARIIKIISNESES